MTGTYRILRVKLSTLTPECVFAGREDEFEYLIEGRVDGVRLWIPERAVMRGPLTIVFA